MRGLPLNFRQVWGLTRQTVSSWTKDYAPSMGAALSYYTLFSIAPLLIIVIAVAGLFFGADAVHGVIIAQLASLMGDESAQAIQEMLSNASRPKTGAIATTVSIFGLLIGATTVFNEYGSRRDEAKAEAPAPAHEPGSHAGGTDAPVEPVPIDWNTLGARSRAGAHAFASHDQAPQPVAAEALAPVRRHKHLLALLAGAGATIGLQVFRRWKNDHAATA